MAESRIYIVRVCGPDVAREVVERTAAEVARMAGDVARAGSTETVQSVRETVRRAALGEAERSAGRIGARLRDAVHLRVGCAGVPGMLRDRAAGELSAGETLALYRRLDRCPECARLTGRLDAAEWHFYHALTRPPGAGAAGRPNNLAAPPPDLAAPPPDLAAPPPDLAAPPPPEDLEPPTRPDDLAAPSPSADDSAARPPACEPAVADPETGAAAPRAGKPRRGHGADAGPPNWGWSNAGRLGARAGEPGPTPRALNGNGNGNGNAGGHGDAAGNGYATWSPVGNGNGNGNGNGAGSVHEALVRSPLVGPAPKASPRGTPSPSPADRERPHRANGGPVPAERRRPASPPRRPPAPPPSRTPAAAGPTTPAGAVRAQGAVGKAAAGERWPAAHPLPNIPGGRAEERAARATRLVAGLAVVLLVGASILAVRLVLGTTGHRSSVISPISRWPLPRVGVIARTAAGSSPSSKRPAGIAAGDLILGAAASPDLVLAAAAPSGHASTASAVLVGGQPARILRLPG